jgi:hypothetical protein
VVLDRIDYVKDSLAKELRRPCWVQKRADDEDLLKLYENGELQRNQGGMANNGLNFMLTITNHFLTGAMKIVNTEES